MPSMPQVKVGEWIWVGSVNGVVMRVHSDHIEIGYHQNKIKAIKEDVVWKNGRWEFSSPDLGGLYLRGSEAEAVKRGPLRKP